MHGRGNDRGNKVTRCVIACDIGGTKLKSGLVAPSGEIIDQLEGASRAREGPAAILGLVQELVGTLLARNHSHQIVGAGVATGGAVDREQGVIRSSADFMPDWRGFAIKKSFESMLASMFAQDVVVDNDGNCALYAEVRRQSLELRDVVFLALGTGLGGAIYSNGRVREGAGALSGHFGQTLVGEATNPDDWRQLETHLSGSGLARLARHVLKERGCRAGAPEAFPDGRSVIAALPASGAAREAAREALSRWTRLLAIVCHNIQWNYDPETIIIGGGMIGAKETWWADFSQALADINERFGLHREMDVRPAALGNDAAMVGAGLMAWEALEAAGRRDVP